MGSQSDSHYSALGLSEDAAPDAIRRAYKQACLAYHPDKEQQRNAGCGPASSVGASRLAAAQLAWAVLGDEHSRGRYDEARRRKMQLVVTDTLHISELEPVGDDSSGDEGSLAEYCRCGGRFLLRPEDQDAQVDLVPCDTCSLAIRVLR